MAALRMRVVVRVTGVLVVVAASCDSGATLAALGLSTHRLINIQAAEPDRPHSFDEFLRLGLGFAAGKATVIDGLDRRMTIQEWLGEGGIREDDFTRSLNHFHDPLMPWESAGLLIGLRRQPSSVRWMQDSNQSGFLPGGSWSWPDARRLYYDALTEPDPTRRDALWATLFRAIGQLMHVVVDASVPEHTRNDMHPLGALHLEDAYETWVSRQHAASSQESNFLAMYLSTPIAYERGILDMPPPAGEEIAVAAVARLIDADQYDGTNPTVTVDSRDHRLPVAVGIAEIANANFFSEDTVRGEYPSPTDTGLVPVNLTTPFGRVRRYLSRLGGRGLLPANPLRAECAVDALFLTGTILEPSPYPCTDELVWGQVAAHMLPRAVGYARGVLEYFFRGSVRVNGISVTDAVSPGVEIPGRTGIWIDIENTSTERMDGVFEVYSRIRKGTPQERRARTGSVNGGVPVSLLPGASGRFKLSLLAGEPTPYQVLVFRGQLGSETDAVVGQVFTVPEVRIAQNGYDAEIGQTCTSRRLLPTWETPLDERLTCTWEPVHHHIVGTLATNLTGANPGEDDAPAIERIQASWQGTVAGPAPLRIDGVEYPDGIWRRAGGEPDPVAFQIVDPVARRESALWLTVSVRGSTRDFTAMMATFKGITHESARKEIRNLHEQELRYVLSWRDIRVPLTINATSHSTESIGGYAVPTPLTLRDQLTPTLWREAVSTTSTLGTYHVKDVFEIVPFSADYEGRFNAIELAAPLPGPPDMHWGAVINPKPLGALSLEFWHAFVAAGDPPNGRITLAGYEADQ